MKSKSYLHRFMGAFAVASLAAFIVLIAADQPLDWSLCGAAFCFGITIPLLLAFTIGFSVHDVLDLEDSHQENALTRCLSLVISLPTLMGCFFLTCHMSIDAGILSANLAALAALIGYYGPTFFGSGSASRRGIRKRHLPLAPAPTIPLAAISSMSRDRNIV